MDSKLKVEKLFIGQKIIFVKGNKTLDTVQDCRYNPFLVWSLDKDISMLVKRKLVLLDTFEID